MRVGLIDYGVGNLGSIFRALEELGVTPILVNRLTNIHSTDCLILPGVGNFTDCARILDADGWATALREEVLVNSRPLLGVCVGMQLLGDSSTEGAFEGQKTSGLGFISGAVRHLSTLGCNLRLPHVGWNEINRTSADDPLLAGIPDGTDFYFVHNYAFTPHNPLNILATVDYGFPICAAVRSGHIWGTQFHPEKSSRAGIRLLKNFIESSAC
jgi:imidazole glycerol-phosphate synthase subunit HisH